MSKPLELTIYPPLAKQPLPFDPDWQGWDAWREWKRLYDREFQQRRDARLTDAELAAEYWRADGGSHITAEYSALEGWFNDRGEEYLSWDAADHWRQTVHRFATSPHYFEVDQ